MSLNKSFKLKNLDLVFVLGIHPCFTTRPKSWEPLWFFLSETEKYAHVTFFFNGGVEKQFEGETRFMVPSPKVATYDLQPEMSAQGVGAEVSQG